MTITPTPSNAWGATLWHLIQREIRNVGDYDSLAQVFEGYDDPVTNIFREIAATKRQHVAKLVHRYNERFGSESLSVE